MNNIRLEKSAANVAAEIEMLQLNWPGSFLVVEGHADSRFWRSRNHLTNDIVIATGRTQVIEALRILNSRGKRGVLGVVDDDFDTLADKPHGMTNVVSTDPRDLEGILLRSSALNKVLAELGDAAKIESFLRTEPPSIRDALLRRCDLFGRIKWANHSFGRQANLRPLKPSRFCDRRTWAYDAQKIKIEAVRLGAAADLAGLDRMLDSLPVPPAWHVCRGHDLIDILVGGLLHVIGNNSGNADVVDAMLRAALDDAEFRETDLWGRCKSWEVSSGFKVLWK